MALFQIGIFICVLFLLSNGVNGLFGRSKRKTTEYRVYHQLESASTPNLNEPYDPYNNMPIYDYEPTIVRTLQKSKSSWGFGRSKGPDEIVEIYNPYYVPLAPSPVTQLVYQPTPYNHPYLHPTIHHALFGHPGSSPPPAVHPQQPAHVPLRRKDSYFSPYSHANHYPEPSRDASPYDVDEYNPYSNASGSVTGTTPSGQATRTIQVQEPISQQQQSTTTTITTVPVGVPPPGVPPPGVPPPGQPSQGQPNFGRA